MIYDSTIIEQFAERLYSEATSVIRRYIGFGVLVGGVLGLFGGPIGVIIGAVVGGYVGASIGKEKAFQLQLQAQIALCQLQIEKNTRK